MQQVSGKFRDGKNCLWWHWCSLEESSKFKNETQTGSGTYTTNQQRYREGEHIVWTRKNSGHLEVTTISINDIADRLSQVNLDTGKITNTTTRPWI